MPNRIIKESALISRQLAGLSHAAERTFWRLIVVADDFGRFSADPVVVKARCYPLLADDIKSAQVKTWIDELVSFGLIELYAIEQNSYGFFVSWDKHQQRRAVKSKFPDPLANDINCNQLQANVLGNEIEIRGDEIDITSANEPTSIPPLRVLKKPDMSVQEFVESWNDIIAPTLPAVVWPLSPTRARKVAARLKEHPEMQFWERVFKNILQSDFLTGKKTNWKANLDFLVTNDTNCYKIYEGAYTNAENGRFYRQA